MMQRDSELDGCSNIEFEIESIWIHRVEGVTTLRGRSLDMPRLYDALGRVASQSCKLEAPAWDCCLGFYRDIGKEKGN